MNKQVEKIKAEIERLKDVFKNEREKVGPKSIGRISLGARIAMLEELLVFIESMKDEDELEGIQKEVAYGFVERINEKRVPIEPKGEVKASFKNEFNTIWQLVDGLQFANVAKHIVERISLDFATWGAYNLKDYIGMNDEEKAKLEIEKLG